MNIKPLYDRVVIKRVEEENKTEGGIVIPDTAKEKSVKGTVIAVGKGKLTESGKLVPPAVKKGDMVGKIYNLLAHRIAKKIYETSEIIKEVYVLLLSRIGRSIDKPQVAAAQILLEPRKLIKDVAPSAETIIGEELQDINRFCLEIAEGKYQIC